MTQEAFCNIHGPYDASLGACPYCQGEGRGGGGASVNEEETRVYSGPGRQSSDIDDMETDIGWRHGESRGGPIDDEETMIGGRGRRGGGRSRWDDDDVEETMLEHAVEGMMGWLIVKKGDRRGKIFTLRKETTIGRKGVTIALNDPKISTLHAKVALVDDDHFVVADVLSKNGTYVNGERIKEQRTLEENDEIRIGGIVLVLKVLPEDEA